MKVQLNDKIIERWKPLIFLYLRTIDESKINLVSTFCEWHYSIHKDFDELSEKLSDIKDKISNYKNTDNLTLEDIGLIFNQEFVKIVAIDEWRNNQIDKLWQN